VDFLTFSFMKRGVFFWINVVGILIALGGAGIGIYASIDPEGLAAWFMKMDLRALTVWLPVGITVFVVLICGAVFAPFIKSAMDNSQKKKRLAMTGIKGNAVILDVRDTGMTVNRNPYIKVTVEVKPGIQASFQMLCSRVQIPRVGDTIEVLYDPSDLTCVMPVLG
jgi:hypothetical protein